MSIWSSILVNGDPLGEIPDRDQYTDTRPHESAAMSSIDVATSGLSDLIRFSIDTTLQASTMTSMLFLTRDEVDALAHMLNVALERTKPQENA